MCRVKRILHGQHELIIRGECLIVHVRRITLKLVCFWVDLSKYTNNHIASRGQVPGSRNNRRPEALRQTNDSEPVPIATR